MVLQSSGPTWTAMATFTFDVFCPEPEHKACAWRWKAWLVPRRRTSAIANIQHAVRCYPGRVLAYAVMKQLLLLMFVAFASEAMAQDAQCVPERVAMVDTIRAYARAESDVLGPQGISERVLEPKKKRNAIGSSPSVLVRSHTSTRRFSLATARQYRSRT